MDIVFEEPLPVEPIQTATPSDSGGDIMVRAASKELSLAWKLLWLKTDDNPQGKDLYDAVLLAEQIRLPRSLLNQVRKETQDLPPIEQPSDFPINWRVGRENFQKEYPWIWNDAAYWLNRLDIALKSMYTIEPGQTTGESGRFHRLPVSQYPVQKSLQGNRPIFCG